MDRDDAFLELAGFRGPSILECDRDVRGGTGSHQAHGDDSADRTGFEGAIENGPRPYHDLEIVSTCFDEFPDEFELTARVLDAHDVVDARQFGNQSGRELQRAET